MKHYSVDIETTGTDPSHSAIIQIAAVEFDPVAKTINPERVFDRCLYMPENRYWDESTREWWMKNPPHVLDGIWNRMENPEAVLRSFADFLGYADKVHLWAKPISFELPFLTSYFNAYKVNMPWHYRDAIDVNSYLRGKGIEDPYKFAKEIPFVGDVHDAIADCLHQAKTVLLC